jgi:hypothetical protein
VRALGRLLLVAFVLLCAVALFVVCAGLGLATAQVP